MPESAAARVRVRCTRSTCGVHRTATYVGRFPSGVIVWDPHVCPSCGWAGAEIVPPCPGDLAHGLTAAPLVTP